MARLSAAERLKALEEKKARIMAQMTALSAKEAKKKRANETRMKILLGSLLLNQRKELGEEWWTNEVLRALDQFLTSERDRELFDLNKRG